MTDKIRANNNFIRAQRIAVERHKDEVIELVNCRYEMTLFAYFNDSDEILLGESMALRDILFELEEM